MSNEKYEIDHPEVKRVLKSIGDELKDNMPDGWGFTLFMFSYGAGGSTFYLSSATREDTISLLYEFISKNSTKQ